MVQQSYAEEGVGMLKATLAAPQQRGRILKGDMSNRMCKEILCLECCGRGRNGEPGPLFLQLTNSIGRKKITISPNMGRF